MATIECPRCETTFETQATTATRCRSCGAVVHLGRRSTSGTTRRTPSATSPSVARAPGGAARHDSYVETTDGQGDLVVLLGVLGVVAGLIGWWWRRKAAERGVDTPASDVAPGAPIATVTPLAEPALATCPLCTTGVARCAIVGCPMAA